MNIRFAAKFMIPGHHPLTGGNLFKVCPEKIEDPYSKAFVTLLQDRRYHADLFPISDEVHIQLNEPNHSVKNHAIWVETTLKVPSDTHGSHYNHRLDFKYDLKDPKDLEGEWGHYVISQVIHHAKAFSNLALQNHFYFEKHPPELPKLPPSRGPVLSITA